MVERGIIRVEVLVGRIKPGAFHSHIVPTAAKLLGRPRHQVRNTVGKMDVRLDLTI